MKEKVIKSFTPDLAVTENAVYVFESEHDKKANTISNNSKPTTKIKPNKDKDPKNEKGWMQWGESDNYPVEVWDKVAKSSLPLRLFEDLNRMHYGAGPYYHNTEIVDSQIIKTPIIKPEIKEFMHRNKILLQLANTVIRDYNIWKMSPVEVVLDRTNHMVRKVRAHDAMFVRWSDKNEDGVIEKAFLSANYPDPVKDQVKELPVIDPYDVEESIDKAPKGKYNFIYPVMELTPGRMYYPSPSWATDNSFNWLEASLLVPIHHRALLQNSMSIKYVIRINELFWPSRFPDWEEKTDPEKAKCKGDVIKKIEETLAGAKNAGKFITTGFEFDDDKNKVVGIEIEAIKDHVNDKAFLMSSAMANSELLFAWGTDPSLVGHGIPGGKELSGSGSDKMRSLQNKQILLACDRIVTLDFLYFISDYNGWDVDWSYRDIVLSTLDNNKDGINKEKNTEDAD